MAGAAGAGAWIGAAGGVIGAAGKGIAGAPGGGGVWIVGAAGAGVPTGAMTGPGGWIGEGATGPGAAGTPAGLTLNRPIRCCPHDWQLSGGVGRLTSAPQLAQT